MTAPIGVRNNNPGNLVYGAGFDGEEEGEGGFGSYPTPVAGGAALIKNLVAYSTKHGLNTVEGIVGRWAPPNENDTTAYAANVANSLGVNATDTLNMQDPGTLAKLATAISKQEGNGAVYNSEFYSALTGNNPELAAYIASAKLPAFSKSMARANAYRSNPNAAGEPAMNIDDTSAIDAVWNQGPVIEQAAALQAGQELAAQTRWAGMGESFVDSLVNGTVTGALVDITQRGEADPNFKITPELFDQMAQNGVLQNKELSDYVSGAINTDDFNRRMELAQERADFFQRAANTSGLQVMGNGASQLLGGMADPVAVIATMGAGWAASAARAGFTTTALSRAVSGAAGGAVGNVAVGAFVGGTQNQTLGWSDILSQGIQGAALGALGHAASAYHDPVMVGVGENMQETMKRGLDNDWNKSRQNLTNPLNEFDNGLSTAMSDYRTTRHVNATNEPDFAPRANRAAIAESLGYAPEPTLPDARYQALHDSGVVMELRSADDIKRVSAFQAKYGTEIPEDAKAFYSPQDDRVYVFRDRLTPEEAADPQGLLMHEVGVHYGLERSVGTERYNTMLEALDTSTDPKVLEAKARVPADTPAYLRGEETLGYLVEKHPTLGVVQSIVSNVKNWLRENIPAFRRMSLTTNDVIQYIKGSLKNVQREGRLSSDLTLPYVWHGSPVAGIDKLDLAFAGTGEGNAAFGFGHYVTTEKGTAIDYRNKESARRGLDGNEGGLYQLKMLADPEQMLAWDRPVSEQPQLHEALQRAGVRDLSGTGGDAYDRLTKKLGSQQAASDALNAVGIPGVKYATGRSRSSEVVNHNFVLFSNDHLDITNRYSRNVKPMYPSNAGPVQLRLSKAAQDVTDAARAWDDTPTPESKLQRERLSNWYNEQRVKLGADKVSTWIDSPGLIVQRSASKVARFIGAHLFEDGTGIGKRESTVALQYEMMQAGYKHAALPTIQENLTKGFTAAEKLQYMLGFGKAAEDRVHREVAVERLAHRAANEAGVKFQSTAPAHIKAMAKALDDFYDNVTSDGKLAGNPYAEAVRGGGFVGFMPYAWDWETISRAYSGDQPRFAAFHENLTQQYTERVVDPAVTDLLKKNPQATPAEVDALRNRLKAKVADLVDNKVSMLMADPQSRIEHFDNAFETIAGDLLKENFDGQVIDSTLLQQFKEQLADIRKDRSRTELDLTREVNGVSLLDFMDYNGERMVAQGAHRFAGLNALARKGYIDIADKDGAIEAARKDGATPEELQALDFGFRAFGMGQLRNAERAGFATLRNFTYAATMGKLGLSVLADASNVVAASGMTGFFRAMGNAFSKDSEFLKQMAIDAPSLLGQDYRLHSLTPDMHAEGRVMIGEGSNLNRVSQRAAQLTSYLNGSNLIGKMLHRGFLPVFAEDMLRTINGEAGGMTTRRLADVGLDSGMLARIKGQLDQFDAGRERGGRINWDKWDDQEAADKLAEAMHRGTFQTFQRAMVGEAPMWLSESKAGALFGQFRRYGIVSTEKQLARNVSIGDTNSMAAFAFGTAWAAMLYYSRLQLNTLGKTDAEKAKYIKDNTGGFKLAAGVFTLMNMSGVLPDAINLGELVFGGNSYQQTSGSPVASMGYLGNVGKAAHSVGSLVTGQSTSHGTDFRNILRIAPLSNSIVGTYISNSSRH
jgi:hypothetical protein